MEHYETIIRTGIERFALLMAKTFPITLKPRNINIIRSYDDIFSVSFSYLIIPEEDLYKNNLILSNIVNYYFKLFTSLATPIHYDGFMELPTFEGRVDDDVDNPNRKFCFIKFNWVL